MSDYEVRKQAAAAPTPAKAELPAEKAAQEPETRRAAGLTAEQAERVAEFARKRSAARKTVASAEAVPKAQSIHQQIVTTLQAWSERHPNPDFPAISFAASGEYSPRQLFLEVERESEVGRFFERVIVNGAQLYTSGIAGVLSAFLSESAAEPSAESR